MIQIYTYNEPVYPFMSVDYQITFTEKIPNEYRVHFVEYEIQKCFNRSLPNKFETEQELHKYIKWFVHNFQNYWAIYKEEEQEQQ